MDHFKQRALLIISEIISNEYNTVALTLIIKTALHNVTSEQYLTYLVPWFVMLICDGKIESIALFGLWLSIMLLM